MLFSDDDIGNVAQKIREVHMNRSLSKRTGKLVFALIILVIALVLGIYLETRPRLAPGQAPLTDIQNIETLRAQFNRDVGQTRLIILVSPT
jgi:hypothetical protein